uniref:Uncharacterized protein n=1 Tax=Physcomitrium patens TaxID=3218 RepID=A0A7I4AIZ4_PHYPA
MGSVCQCPEWEQGCTTCHAHIAAMLVLSISDIIFVRTTSGFGRLLNLPLSHAFFLDLWLLACEARLGLGCSSRFVYPGCLKLSQERNGFKLVDGVPEDALPLIRKEEDTRSVVRLFFRCSADAGRNRQYCTRRV